MECTNCCNTTENPSIKIIDGLCNICAAYKSKFNPQALKKEFEVFKGLAKYFPDVMVGISGGKDSTATLHLVKELGFRPLAFTFDIGYYPEHIFSRAKAVAQQMDVPYEKIDITSYITNIERDCYHQSLILFDRYSSPEAFRCFYEQGLKYYSVKQQLLYSIPFVRSCRLCRRIVIRAYYEEAVQRNIKFVVLGMNEWAGLSKTTFNGIRCLKPFKHKPEVNIVHLPYLMQHTIEDTHQILKSIGWHLPDNESLVESNANSCLFALATETKAKEMLGFHPDAGRLSREVTAGFISKAQAKAALNKSHSCDRTLEEVLSKVYKPKIRGIMDA